MRVWELMKCLAEMPAGEELHIAVVLDHADLDHGELLDSERGDRLLTLRLTDVYEGCISAEM